VQAVNVARSISEQVTAVFITDDQEAAVDLREGWQRQGPGVPLVVVESPYRALVGPLVAYLDVLDRAWPPDKPAPITFVVLPEYVARSWWERILYNQSARRLRSVLLGRPHTVIVGVPYRRDDADRLKHEGPDQAGGVGVDVPVADDGADDAAAAEQDRARGGGIVERGGERSAHSCG